MKENNNVLASSISLFKPSKIAFMRNIKTFSVVLAPTAIYELYNLVASFYRPEHVDATSDLSTASIVLLILTPLVFVPIMLVVSALSVKLQLEAAKGNTLSFKELWKSTKSRILPFIYLSLSVALRVLVGLILFIVPGIIAIRKYIMSPYVFMEDNSISVSEAMRKSTTLTAKPYSGYVWGVFGVSVLLTLFGIIPHVGSLITFIATSLYSIALPLRYLEIKKLVKS